MYKCIQRLFKPKVHNNQTLPAQQVPEGQKKLFTDIDTKQKCIVIVIIVIKILILAFVFEKFFSGRFDNALHLFDSKDYSGGSL